MWLINVQTRKLEYFADLSITPPYAILSHTWGADEVSMGDYRSRNLLLRAFSTTPTTPGWSKIDNTCTQAIKDQLGYVWVDTCCIDKTSSAELSESINSMYRWYSKSVRCYAYLSDVELGSEDQRGTPGSSANYSVGYALETVVNQISSSRWFTRGWTLQELLAPEEVQFFDKYWSHLGSLPDLGDAVSKITRIPVEILLRVAPLQAVPVAHKMSWAADRSTTRVEDRAYSLLGLFDLHMPLLYGEGEQAFVRLLEVIMRNRPDSTILCHLCSDDPAQNRSHMVPQSPTAYKSADRFNLWEPLLRTPAVEVNSAGIRIRVRLILHENAALAVLSCGRKCGQSGNYLSIALKVNLFEEDGMLYSFLACHDGLEWRKVSEVLKERNIFSADSCIDDLGNIRTGDNDSFMLVSRSKISGKSTAILTLIEEGHAKLPFRPLSRNVIWMKSAIDPLIDSWKPRTWTRTWNTFQDEMIGGDVSELHHVNGRSMLLAWRYWSLMGKCFPNAPTENDFTSKVRRAGSNSVETSSMLHDARTQQAYAGLVAGFLHDIPAFTARSYLRQPHCPLVMHMDYFESDESTEGIEVEVVTTRSRYEAGFLHEVILKKCNRKSTRMIKKYGVAFQPFHRRSDRVPEHAEDR